MPLKTRNFWKRLSKDTGGHYYTLGNASQIPEEMTYIDRPNSLPQTLPLWDMPALFLDTMLACSFPNGVSEKQIRLP